MNVILKFCFMFWLIYETEGQTARCDYKYEYRVTYNKFEITNTSYYKCDLDTHQANYVEKLTRIVGQHGFGHTNADVKWIENYKSDKLKTFSSIFCQNFPNLERIEINHAKLESIDEDSLSNCQNLDKLELQYNKIREIPENLLIKNPKLTELLIFFNQLTTMPANLFHNQKELESLNLNFNQINFLPSNIFRSLVKLEELELDNNKLQSINPEWFVNLHNLKRLHLSTNQISEIPSKCFASLRKLASLWIYENKIKTLNSDSFDGLQNLQNLALQNNEISDLPVGILTELNFLKMLNFNNNKLTTIHSDSFGVHNRLKAWFEHNKINAIDEKFIDNPGLNHLFLRNNICSQSNFYRIIEIKNNLRNCFANYQPRSVQIQTQSSCGRSIMPQGNIIGGVKIKRGSYPWIAALYTQKGQFFCGGTLVSNRKVVTAAHCIQEKGLTQPLLPRSVSVLLGFHDLINPYEIGRAKYAVQSIHIHPDWSPYTNSYDADIAVLMLHRDVQFNEHIQPICMTSADPRMIASMTDGAVVGNGKGGQYNEYENIPKILKMPIQTDQHCTEKDNTFRNLLTGRAFCAGRGTGQGVCTGDSGSGFFVKIGNVYYLRGIVSVSLADTILGCDVNSYSVFTNVLKFTRWINRLTVAVVINDQIIFPS